MNKQMLFIAVVGTLVFLADCSNDQPASPDRDHSPGSRIII